MQSSSVSMIMTSLCFRTVVVRYRNLYTSLRVHLCALVFLHFESNIHCVPLVAFSIHWTEKWEDDGLRLWCVDMRQLDAAMGMERTASHFNTVTQAGKYMILISQESLMSGNLMPARMVLECAWAARSHMCHSPRNLSFVNTRALRGI